MHRFFESPELLLVLAYKIFGEEDNGDEPDLLEDLHEGHTALTQFALVCKTFSIPAFDVLWRSVEFSSLFSILPLTPITENGVLTFTRGVSQADLDRFLFYSRRIKTLSHSHGYWVTHGISVADDLRNAFLAKGFGGTLFPNLRSLNLGCHKSWEWVNSVLLAPTITKLRLEHQALAPDDFASLSQYIADFCVNIRVIEFEIPLTPENGTNSDALARYFSQTQSLRHVYCCFQTSPSVLEQLSRLPQLKILAVGGYENPLPRLPTSPLHTFSALRELTALSPSVENAKESLQTFNCPLKRLAIEYETEGADGLHGLLVEIEHKFGSSLEELVICMNGTAEQQAGPWNERMITPHCSRMSQLTSLKLHSAFEIPLDDNALATLGKELPRLHVVHLSTSRSGVDYTPSATLTGLFNLLSSCHSLVELRLDLDARGVRTYTSLPSSSLISLELGWSPIDDMFTDVAELLSEALPVLEILCWSKEVLDEIRRNLDEEGVSHIARWEHVIKSMETLQRVRREERKQFEERVAELEKQLSEAISA